MKIKLSHISLWLLTILWLIFIFILSSQNGTQTAETSEGIAEKVAQIIYQQPTGQQVNQVHLSIRKSAHISLFLALGALSFSVAFVTFGWKNRNRKVFSVAVAAFIASAYGFFDEWHKQFIDGRHFQVDEAMLNIVCGIVGVLIAMTAVYCI